MRSREKIVDEPATKVVVAHGRKPIKVPCNLLGIFLDPVKKSDAHFCAHAVYMLAVKCSKGKGYVLNEKTMTKSFAKGGYNMGRRGFRGGIRLMKQRGGLDRWQPHRKALAKEQLKAESENYITIDEALLRHKPKNHEKLVTFILVVNLSPTPTTPTDAAARLGITSPTTAYALAWEAIATGRVEHAEVDRNKILLARKGKVFDHSKNVSGGRNVPSKNVLSKNGASHSILDDLHNSREKTQNTEITLCDATRSAERREQRAVFFEPKLKALGDDWSTLSDWKSSSYFRGEHELLFNGTVRPVMGLDLWHNLLKRYGGAPDHLYTPVAHQQALEVAHELHAVAGSEDGWVSPFMAMVGLAFEVSKANANGKLIRSLGFIAERLVRRAESGDVGWAYNLPSRLPAKEFQSAYEFAQKAVEVLELHEISIDRRELLSTFRVEELSSMLSRHTRKGVADGVNNVTRNKLGPLDDCEICGWAWFEDAIAAAKIANVTPAAFAAPASVPETPLPESSLRTLIEADGAKVLSGRLRNQGESGLASFLATEAAIHKCAPGDVLAVMLDIVRRAAIDGRSAVAEVTDADGKMRGTISKWNLFNPSIRTAMKLRTSRAANA